MDWKATLEEILAERRQRLGERPSIDELIALRAGELSQDDHQRLLEHAAVDREVAGELFDVLRFPERSGEEDPGPDEQGVGRRWQALRARLVAEGELPAKDTAARVSSPPFPPSAEPMRGVLSPLGPPKGKIPAAAGPASGRPAWLPLAAMFLLGVAATLTVGRFRDPGPDTTAEARINLPIVELLPVGDDDAGVRGGAEVATLAADAGGLVLTLAVPGLAPPPDGGPYTLELVRGDGTTSTVGGLYPGVGGVFVLDLPRGAWSDGLHELRLRRGDGQPVARFRLRVELHR